MIGRKNERNILKKLYETKESKLAVVYGRRRIGKTYLIDEMIKEKQSESIIFTFTGDYEGDKKTQLTNFAESIHDWFNIDTETLADWTQAFNILKRIINKEIKDTNHKGKVIIFFDEVPWIDRANKANFLSAFGHFWNNYCLKQDNFLMILCGSNAAWIQNKILKDAKGPHHKRIDEIIALKPFTLKETALYLEKEKQLTMDPKLTTEIYMIFGGVAKYLSYYDKEKSIAQNINDLFFSIDGLLYGEYEQIFKSLFHDKERFHKEVIDLLCETKTGVIFTDIAKKMKLSTSNPRLRNAINDLICCGMIISIQKIQSSSNNAKYIIADPFILFYNKWVSDLSKNAIAKSSNHWESIQSSQAYAIWTGFAFEIICLTNIEMYLSVRGLSATFKNASYWSYVNPIKSIEGDKGAQIDILIEYENDVYDIVECKYYDKQFVISSDYKRNLQNKKDMFIKHGIKKKKFDLKLIMLTTYGTAKNSSYNDLPIFKDITLDEFLE